jgi:hypothetical protein
MGFNSGLKGLNIYNFPYNLFGFVLLGYYRASPHRRRVALPYHN